MRFEWDPVKEAANQANHGMSFGQATSLFTSGVDYLEIVDDAHSDHEDRLIAIGPIARGVIMVVFTERIDETIRIMFAQGLRPYGPAGLPPGFVVARFRRKSRRNRGRMGFAHCIRPPPLGARPIASRRAPA